MHDESQTNHPDDLLASSLPSRLSSYRPLSAKRPRDPSHRKSVSFNDVPIVHEVPSHDAMRNSNSDIYRSWTYTDVTSPITINSPFSSSQILSPFNSTSAAAQKIHANRLSSALYSSTNSTTLNRSNDWTTRGKTIKPIDESLEQSTNSNPPLIIVHTPDERTNRNSSINQSLSSENSEEKKHAYRSPIVPDTEHYRNVPFTYVPLSESTTTYTSMLSTNLIPSNHSSNDQSPAGHSRTIRVRSATLPMTVSHPSARNNESILVTPFRTIASTTLSNGPSISLSPRTVLKPTTIAFQSAQSIIPNTSPKPPIVSPRISSSTPHSRFNSTSNRPLSSSIKYAYSNSTIDPTSKSTPATFPRSRSANILTARRNASSPVVMLDGQSGGTNNTNLSAATKRNPNVRQTYGSYYMHRVLLPANIN